MKVLVDVPDELYDTLRSKTLYLTSGARSNGKHLVCELIGCVLNGEIINDVQTEYNVYKTDDLTIISGHRECSTCEHEVERDGSNCYECIKGIKNRYSPKETIEIKYGEKNLIKMDYKLGEKNECRNS